MQKPAAIRIKVASHVGGAASIQNRKMKNVAIAIQITHTRGERPPKKRSVIHPAEIIPRIPEISNAATSIGTLIAGASEKSVIATTDKIALSDSASSGILKWGSTADILQALYLLGIPRTTFQTAFPFVLPPGDGGTNGLTFTGGGGGAFTLSAAPLAGLFSGLSGSGSYVYLPANAGGSGNAAGWYYCVFSSDTAGTIYGDQYTGGQPQIVGSPGEFGGAPSGRITTPTSEIVALSGINLLPVGYAHIHRYSLGEFLDIFGIGTASTHYSVIS